MIYPKGTPVNSISHWDRSTKVLFACASHPQKVWASKQPAVSTWFPRDESVPDECTCLLASYVTTEPYDNGVPTK